jgi:hypothetical protein
MDRSVIHALRIRLDPTGPVLSSPTNEEHINQSCFSPSHCPYLLPVQRLEVREHELAKGVLDELPLLQHGRLQPAATRGRERESDAVVVVVVRWVNALKFGKSTHKHGRPPSRTHSHDTLTA